MLSTCMASLVVWCGGAEGGQVRGGLAGGGRAGPEGVLGGHCSFPHLMPVLSCPLLSRNQADLLRGPPPITFPVFLNPRPPTAGCPWELWQKEQQGSWASSPLMG